MQDQTHIFGFASSWLQLAYQNNQELELNFEPN